MWRANAGAERAARRLGCPAFNRTQPDIVSRRSARARLSIQHDGVNTAVARLTAELADVQYGLDQTVVRAQTEGFVTQVALRRCVPPWFSLITNKADQNLGAAFQQNSLQRVKAGDEAEVAFDAVPGRVFKGSPSPQIRFSQAER